MNILKCAIIMILFFAMGASLSAQEIFEAVKKNDVALVKSLLEKTPALVNARDADGRTPLHWAARTKPAKLELIQLLSDSGADINARDNVQTTPLHSVVSSNQIEAAKLLIVRGANVNETDRYGSTALYLAARLGWKGVVELLKSKGAGTSPARFPVLKGEYLGQKKPGITPELFAPGIVSTVYLEHSPVAFSPDGKEAYWTSDFRDFGTTEGRIFYATQENGKWTLPRVASFSENLNCYNPVFSDDGNEIYYFTQPVEETKKPVPHIYKVERRKKGWSEPCLVEIPGMKGYLMTQFSLGKNDTLYFSTDSEDGKGSFDIYRSRLVNGRYSEPENLGDSINGPYWDSYPYIDRQEKFLIFTSVGRHDGHGGMDLYISFSKDDGSWMESVNMGDKINTKGVEGLANLSPDGKWMFFISDRNGNVDVYWVDARIIEELQPKDLKSRGEKKL